MVCECCKTDNVKYEAMTHEERVKASNKMKYAGMGMVVSGLGTFGGLMGGLSGSSMGVWGALGVAVGASVGLISGSCGLFAKSKEIEKIDQELQTTSGILLDF